MTARQTVGPPVGSKWMNVLGQPVTVVAVTQDAHGGVLITLDTENRVRQYMDMKTWNNIEEKTAIPPPELPDEGSHWTNRSGDLIDVVDTHTDASGRSWVRTWNWTQSQVKWTLLAIWGSEESIHVVDQPENNREKEVWNAAIRAAITEAGTLIDDGYLAERIRNLIK